MAQIMYNLPYNFCQTFIPISDLSGMYDWVKDYVQTEDMSAYTGVPTKAKSISKRCSVLKRGGGCNSLPNSYFMLGITE